MRLPRLVDLSVEDSFWDHFDLPAEIRALRSNQATVKKKLEYLRSAFAASEEPLM